MALELIDKVKTMTGETDEALVSIYLDIAAQKILSRAYPFDDTATIVPPRYTMLQCEIAAYLLNKRGAEGQSSHSENGISRTWPEKSRLLSRIVPHVGSVVKDA